jgi:divalent metal cation (Fe/Co/Zn/Cd) transporter
VKRNREIAGSYDNVDYVNEVLTMHMGPDFVLVNLSIDFTDTATSKEVERIVVSIDAAIKRVFPVVKRVFIEGEARKPDRPGRAEPLPEPEVVARKDRESEDSGASG